MPRRLRLRPWISALLASGSLAFGCGAGPAALEPAPSRARPVEVPTRERAAVIGTWYLNAGGARLAVEVTQGASAIEGALLDEATGARTPLRSISWEPASGRLRFRHDRDVSRVWWYDARVVEGVIAGRFAPGVGDREPSTFEYTGHFTGWNSAVFDRELVPRAFDLRADNGARARVRVDRDPTGRFVGTLKLYAFDGVGALAEDLERDLQSVSWDGAALSFRVERDGVWWTYSGSARGRTLAGTALPDGAAVSVGWTATRAEVLSHGITVHARASLDAWRTATRRALVHLVMPDAPAAPDARVTVTRVIHDATVAPAVLPVDGPGSAPRAGWSMTELLFEHTFADPRGGPDLRRRSHGYLGVPAGPTPPGGYFVVLALNGHGGSARQVMTPGNRYSYGEAYARRGYVVLAIDVSHRRLADREDLYDDTLDGDDPGAGNGPHPAIASEGFDTDWEEDGERVWDAMRALDYLGDRYDLRPGHVIATGLSMGGEVATLFGALDPRVDAVVSAGFSPDFPVIRSLVNHPCWRWRYADIEEYLDVSDEHALIAPRTLVVETGLADWTFSFLRSPFAGDKQVLRRSRTAFMDDPSRLVHDLHAGGHGYHVGVPKLDGSAEYGLSLPLLIAPDEAAPLAWQTDATTTQSPSSVFDLTRENTR